jgi:hypothetical protein
MNYTVHAGVSRSNVLLVIRDPTSITVSVLLLNSIEFLEVGQPRGPTKVCRHTVATAEKLESSSKAWAAQGASSKLKFLGLYGGWPFCGYDVTLCVVVRPRRVVEKMTSLAVSATPNDA